MSALTRFTASAEGRNPVSAPATRTDLQALDELLAAMSSEAQIALLWRGFGSAVLRRMESVEHLDVRRATGPRLASWLAPLLNHAGLDASMLELFHVAGGVPWARCRAIARTTHIPITSEPPGLSAPAEHDPQAIVLTVSSPPSRQRWSTRALLGALQGLHRRLEDNPALRSPAARPLLVGISEDDRHLVLRASPGTRAALLAMSPSELASITGLPVRMVGGTTVAPDQSHRPVIVALTMCAIVLLASLVAHRWSAGVYVESARTAQATALSAEREVARLQSVLAVTEPVAEPVVEALEVAGPDPHPPQPDPLLEEPEWLGELTTRMARTGANVDHDGSRVTVSFSDELLAFDPGDAALDGATSLPIKRVAAFLRQHPEILVWVEGHTDDAAYSSGNWLLGAQRALAVVQALTQAGLSPRRVVLTSHGEHRPVAPNTTAEGRQKNRRVELVLAAEARIGG